MRVVGREPFELLGESAENLNLMRLLDEEYTRRPFYGSRRMMSWLHEQGYAVGRHRVRRLMGLLGLEAIYPKPKLSQPGRTQDLPVPVERSGRHVDQPGMEMGHHQHPHGERVPVPGGGDGLVQPARSQGLSVSLEMDFCLAGTGACARRRRPESSTVTRVRSSRPRGSPAFWQAGRGDQHGRPWPLPGQHLH